MGMRHAVLGAALEGPASRYDLLVRLQRDFPLWHFTSGGVYHAVEALTPHLLQRRDDGTYELTPAGRSHLRSWVRKQSSPGPLRDDLRLQIAYSEVEDLPWIEAQVRVRLAWVAKRIVELHDGGLGPGVRRIAKPWSTVRMLVVRAIQREVLGGIERALRRAHAEIVDTMERHAIDVPVREP